MTASMFQLPAVSPTLQTKRDTCQGAERGNTKVGGGHKGAGTQEGQSSQETSAPSWLSMGWAALGRPSALMHNAQQAHMPVHAHKPPPVVACGSNQPCHSAAVANNICRAGTKELC